MIGIHLYLQLFKKWRLLSCVLAELEKPIPLLDMTLESPKIQKVQGGPCPSYATIYGTVSLQPGGPCTIDRNESGVCRQNSTTKCMETVKKCLKTIKKCLKTVKSV